MFGGFLDSTQPFGNFFGNNTEQPYTQPPFFGMDIDQQHAMYFIQSTCGNTQIQPNTPYIGGASTTPFVYQQFSSISSQYNSNQFVGQQRLPSYLVQNGGVQNEGVGRVLTKSCT